MEEQELQRENGDIPISDDSRNEAIDLPNLVEEEDRQPQSQACSNPKTAL